MAVNGVGGEADQFYSTLGELRFELGESAEFGGAHGGVILRMGEENDPLITDEFMKIDWSIGGVGFEVGSLATKTQTKSSLSMLTFLMVCGEVGGRLVGGKGGFLTARDGPRLKPWHVDILIRWKRL